MFGFGKKKQEELPAIDPSAAGGEEDEFFFEEGDEADDRPFPGEEPAAAAKGPKLPPVNRLLVYALLLVAVAAGGAYFLLFSEPEPPPAPVKTQKVKKSVAPKPAAPPTQAGQSAPSAAPDKAVTAPQKSTAAAPAPAPAKAVAAAASQTPAAKPSATTPAAPADKPAPVATAATTTKAAPVPPQATPARALFTVVSGAYLDPENLKAAERVVRRLGYEPKIRKIMRPVPMLRLRAGLYAPAEAPMQLTALQSVAPGAFSLPEGERVALYAATFQNRDKAREFAENLAVAGIRLEEVPVTLQQPLRQVLFGAFASRDEAETAAAAARRAGLDAAAVRR